MTRSAAALACFFLSLVSGLRGAELSKTTQSKIETASPGSFLVIPELLRAWRQVPVIPLEVRPLPGPRLLFSDMPEYLREDDGISLMEDITPGGYRLYVYHVPGIKGHPKTVTATVENLGTAPLHLDFNRYAFVKPGMDYPAMGVEGLMQFFTGHEVPPTLTVRPQTWQILDPQLDQTVAADPQLVHALYEFHIDQPARVAVLQRNTNESSANIVNALPKMPRQLPGRKSSGAGRGIFQPADVSVSNTAVIDSAGGIQRLLLADGRRDPWVRGVDGLAGNMAVTNKGSYGVVYHIRLSYSSSDGRPMAILVGAPGRRSSGETRPMAALKVGDQWMAIAATRGEAKERGTFALAQKLPASKPGLTNYIDMIYSPPGGSSLPTPIYFAPY